jgi:hypothetical protein
MAEDIYQTIVRAEALAALLQKLIDAGRTGIYAKFLFIAAKIYLLALIEDLKEIFIVTATDEIQAVVGSDFNPNQSLDFEALVDRFQLLPSIADLDASYSITLTGTNETLGVWLTNPVADLTLANTISQAVEATAQALYTQIDSWDDPNTGYLRSATPDSPTDFLTSYLESLLNADSPATAFRIVVDTGSNLLVTLAPTAYSSDPNKLFGYLDGWDYARFARRIIQIDWDIYEAISKANVASRLWNSQNWLPTANALLRTDWSGVSGFADRGVVCVDPVYSLTSPNSPRDIINAWRVWVENGNPPGTPGRPVCGTNPTLCPVDCYVSQAYTTTSNSTDLNWAGAPRSDDYLPYFPKSIITGCQNGRISLARATFALWAEFDVYQDLTEIAKFVNALEHGTVFPSPNDSVDEQARIDLMHFLHYIYRQTQASDRDVIWLAAMSSAILEVVKRTVLVDDRAHKFLQQLLTPVTELADGAIFADVNVNIDWDSDDTSQYSDDLLFAVNNGAIRIFGNTEYNNLTAVSQAELDSRGQGASSSNGWAALYVGSGGSVYLMTIEQFNYAQDLPKKENSG